MNSPPAVSKPGQGGRDLGHLHQREHAFVHAGPAAGAGNDDQRQVVAGGPLDAAGELLAHHRAHAAHDEGRIGDAEGHAPGADHAGAGHGGVFQAGPLLLVLELLLIGAFVDELQRIGRLEVGVPFLEGAFVEELADPLPGRDVPVVIALGADAQPLLGLLAEDGGLAAGAAHPQALGHAPLGALHAFFQLLGSGWRCMASLVYSRSIRQRLDRVRLRGLPSGRGCPGPSTDRPARRA